MKNIKVEVHNLTNYQLPPQSFFQKIIDTVVAVEKLKQLKPHKVKQPKVSLTFITSGASQQLNKAWRGKNAPTTSLSFSFEAPTHKVPELYLGEIFMAPSVMLHQAKLAQRHFRSELTHQCVHAMLHVLGYDHQRSAFGASEMEKLQSQALRRLLK